jgi:outer membrane biosynthesis protein TonB
MADKTFQIALIISATLHSLVFLSVSPRFLGLGRRENIRIAYLKNPPQRRQTIRKELIDGSDRLHNTRQLIDAARVDRASFARSEPSGSTSISEYMPKPLSMKESFPAFKKKVTLPQLELNFKIKNPSYTGYYELIREKIRHAAYQNYAQTDVGDVYIAFVVGSDGELKDVHYIEDRSAPSYYLKEIALRSIKEASPFPRFPQGLDYPQLSFNVIISFQIDNS